MKVLIINHTDTVASFFEDWNLWGYFNIWFEVKSKDSVFYLSKKMRDWPKNFPSFKSLFPGDTLVLNFDNKSYECPFSQLSGSANIIMTPGNSIRAVYQLGEATLNSAKQTGFVDSNATIKFKYELKDGVSTGPRRRRLPGDWIIVDSIANPVPLYQTFPRDRLESDYYKLY